MDLDGDTLAKIVDFLGIPAITALVWWVNQVRADLMEAKRDIYRLIEQQDRELNAHRLESRAIFATDEKMTMAINELKEEFRSFRSDLNKIFFHNMRGGGE